MGVSELAPRLLALGVSVGCTGSAHPSKGVSHGSSSTSPQLAEVGPVATCGPATSIDGQKVCLDPTPRDFLDAERNCRALGGSLFELTSHERSMAVNKAFGIIGLTPSLWIGVFRTEAGPWQLAHTGEALPFEQWAEGEPNDAGGEEDCVEVLRNGRWNDARCGLQRPFLCQPSGDTPWKCTGTLLDEDRICLHPEERTFLFAQRACYEEGGRLLTVATFEEGERLTNVIGAGNGDVWFGLSDLAEEGTWASQSGSRIPYRAWRPGEPNDAGERGEDCAVVGLHDAQWNDLPCEVKTRSLCAVPAGREGPRPK